MKKRFLALFLCAAMVAGMLIIPTSAANNGAVSNLVDSYTAGSGSFSLKDGSRFYVVADNAPSGKLLETVQLAASNFAAAGKPKTIAMKIAYGPESGAVAGDIIIKQTTGLADEGYRLQVTASNVTVSFTPGASSAYYGGASFNGLHYGLQEVLKMMMVNGGITLDCCTVTDAPDTKERTLMLDMARKYWSVNWVENLIRQASWMGYNAIQLHLTEDQGIRANIWRDKSGNTVLDCNGNDFAWTIGANPVSWNTNYRDGNNSYNRDELTEIINLAKQYHIEVIPSVDFPTHADALIAKFASNYVNAGRNFSFNFNGTNYNARPSLAAYNNATLNVTDNYARNLCYAFVDAYADFFGKFGCSKFCICGDEVSGASSSWASASYTRNNGGSSAKDAYVIFMNEWARNLKNRGYKVRAYNDCLFGTGFYVNGSKNTAAANIDVDKDIDVLFWTAESSHTSPSAMSGSRTVYNCVNFYTYYVLRVSGSGYDARNEANTWWTFNHATAERIYSGCGKGCTYGSACSGEGWNPSRFYGCSNGTYRQTVTNNLGGGYFLIWGDWAGYDSESNIWTRNDGYNLITRMWSNAVKMWDWDANSHLSYSSFANNYVAKLRHFPGYTSPSALPTVPGSGTPIVGGVYTISASGDSNFCLSANGTGCGANVQLSKAVNSDTQRWTLLADANGFYNIYNLATGLSLDVNGAFSADGTNVQLWTANDSAAQKWSIQDNGDGTFALISRCGSKALDLSNGVTKEGQNVQIWGQAPNCPAQKWILELQPVLDDGVYIVGNSANAAYGLDVAGVSKDNGANIEIWQYDEVEGVNQRFRITPDADGLYTIYSTYSGLALDCAGGACTNGTNVQQYTPNGTLAQKWAVIRHTDGTYSFVSAKSGKLLDMSGGGAPKNGTNVHIWEPNYGTAQKWVLRSFHTHHYTTQVTPATCTANGQEVRTCECGDTITTVIPAAGHKSVTDPAVAATCTTDGRTEGEHCSVCGTVLKAQQTVPAAHKEVKTAAVAATCEADGKTEGITCSACGKVIKAVETIPATGHKAVNDAAVEATCTKTGLTAGSHCATCGKVLVKQETVPMKAHTVVTDAAVESTCTKTGLTEGSHCSVCGTVLKTQQTIAMKPHTEVVDPAVEATCDHDGKTEGSHCAVCGTVLKAQTTIPAAHTPVVDAAVAATCEQDGKTEGSHCATCGKVLKAQTVIPAGHTEVTSAAVAATCTTAGKTEGITCSVCGKVIKAVETIPATGHKLVSDPAVAATCAAEGKTEGKHCSVCGTVTVAQQPIAKLAHTEVKDAAVAPTYTATGLTEGSHCSVCGAVIVPQQTVARLKSPLDYSNLPTGIYTIKSAGGNVRLDVEAQSTAAGGNVHVWSSHTGNVQKWIIRSLGNGYYTIENLHSHLYLDVNGASSADGTNVHQWTANSSAAQQWKIVNNGDGTCTFLSACGGKAMDIAGGKYADGSNVCIWSRNNGLNQKWELSIVPVVQDGVYTIANSANTGFVADVANGATANGTNIAMAAAANTDAQKFVIRSDGSGFYTIRHAASGKALDVNGGGKANGTNIHLYDYNGTDAQKWLIVPNSNGTYTFISKCNGLAFDMSGGGAPKAGTNIHCWSLNNGTAQQWKLFSATIGKEGVYTIAPSGNTSVNLAVAGSSTAQGANIGVASEKQSFVIVSFDDGTYGIRSLKSGLYLNASGNGTANGTNIIQYGNASTPAANERWALIPNFDGTYSFVGKQSGLYLNLDGTNAQLWSATGKASQRWLLSTPIAAIPDGTYQLLCAASTGYGLDVDVNNGNAGIWSKHTNDNQKFILTHVGGGYYKITCKATGKVLDVNGGTAKAGTNVQQWAYNGTNAQLWAAIPNRDGSYTFYSKLGGFVLDVNGGTFANGSNVQIWTPNGTAAQNWKLG